MFNLSASAECQQTSASPRGQTLGAFRKKISLGKLSSGRTFLKPLSVKKSRVDTGES